MFCPFIPVSGITMEETVDVSQEKLLKELEKNLKYLFIVMKMLHLRKSEEILPIAGQENMKGLKKKLADPEWKPDFGPATV